VSEIIIYLHRLVQVLIEYFKELEEESIRDNFVIIYELLDEMMDFGFPQTTESKILQECAPPKLSHTIYLSFAQVYYSRIAQVGDPSPAPTLCHQCSFVAL
jgi:hypothetical protein